MPAQFTHSCTGRLPGTRSDSLEMNENAESVNADGVGGDLNNDLNSDYPVGVWSARTTNGG